MKHTYIDVETYKYNETTGYYEEILDATQFYYGGIQEDDENNTTTYYKNKQEMYENILLQLQKQNNHIWAYHHAYDFYAYTKDNLQSFIKNPDIKIIRQQPLMIINTKTGSKLIDLKAYYDGKLENHGEALGIKKLPRKTKVKKHEELQEYLKRDIDMVRKLVELIIETYKETNYNPRKLLTGAKSAMGRFMSHVHKQPGSGYLFKAGKIHKQEYTIPFLRQASKGGRTETHKTGYQGNCKYADINSFYMEIMRTLTIPDLLKEQYYNKELCKHIPIKTLLKKQGVSKATIHIKTALPIGILAIRYTPQQSKKYKLVFPHKKGTILKGWWTHSEINFAIKHGYEVLKIHECVRYNKNLDINPLATYIPELYKHRRKKQEEKTAKSKLQAKLIKKLGTGLYGKFIQQQEEKIYNWIPRHEKENYEEKGWKIVGEQGDYCISKTTNEYIPPYQSIILGALIAAEARIQLTEKLLGIPYEQLVATDTDGIIIKGKIPKHININNELGNFKIQDEGETYTHKAKTYMIGKTIKIAGVPQRNQTPEYFTKLEPVKRHTMKTLHQNNPNYKEIGKLYEETVKPEIKQQEELPTYIEEYAR